MGISKLPGVYFQVRTVSFRVFHISPVENGLSKNFHFEKSNQFPVCFLDSQLERPNFGFESWDLYTP